jgi:hypothetical protein
VYCLKISRKFLPFDGLQNIGDTFAVKFGPIAFVEWGTVFIIHFTNPIVPFFGSVKAV